MNKNLKYQYLLRPLLTLVHKINLQKAITSHTNFCELFTKALYSWQLLAMPDNLFSQIIQLFFTFIKGNLVVLCNFNSFQCCYKSQTQFLVRKFIDTIYCQKIHRHNLQSVYSQTQFLIRKFIHTIYSQKTHRHNFY